MFERYSEQARRVLFFARFEAAQLASASIEPGHLLLGLLRERRGLAARLLKEAQVVMDDVKGAIGDLGRSPLPVDVEIPFTENTKLVLRYTAEEADRLLHSDVGTEHLLLGLLRHEGDPAASVLAAHGMRLEVVRDEVVLRRREQEPTGPDRPPLQAGDAVAVRAVHIVPSRAVGSGSERGTPDSWTLEGFPLKTALSRATGFPETRIELSTPLDGDTRCDFSVLGLRGTRPEARERLLLDAIQEHFDLTVSHEPRTMDVYVLSLPDRPTFNLQPNPPSDFGGGTASMHVSFSVPSEDAPPELLQQFGTQESARAHLAGGFITGATASGLSMADFAQMLEQALDRLVVDETHLAGFVDLEVVGEAASTPAFFQMLRDQYGLLMAPAMRQVTLLVVQSH